MFITIIVVLLHNWSVKSVIIVQDPDVLLFEELGHYHILPCMIQIGKVLESWRILRLVHWRKHIMVRTIDLESERSKHTFL